MRLIDADAFIEYANRRLDLCSDELRMMIEEQPTAYDVDKVVEQLTEASESVTNDFAEEMYKNIRTDRAIDIVRKGGVE